LAIYWLSRKFFSNRTAGISALLLAVFPLHVYYSREAANYSLFFLLTLLSFGFFWKALTKEQVRWSVLFGLISLANLYTNYFALTLLISQLALAVFSFVDPCDAFENAGVKPALRKLRCILVSGLIAFSLFLPWALWTSESTSASYPSVFSESGLPFRIFKEISGGSYPLSTLLFLLGLGGLYSLYSQSRRHLVILLVTWFLIPSSLVLFLDWSRGYFFAIRQILFATPPLLMTAAAGIAALGTSRKSFLATGLFMLTGLGTITLNDSKNQADWKGLDSYLQANITGDALISAPNIERVITYRYPEMENRKVDVSSVHEILERPNPPSLYLIGSRYATSAQRATLNGILDTHPFQRSFEVLGFEVYVLK
jgi:uncharacterized membrane protein